MKLNKYSIGIGDRFGHQGAALLTAVIKAEEKGIKVTPVWNKSLREHQITKTKPISVLQEAESAVRSLQWKGDYYIDADHINLSSVELFLDSSNYFTLDVADSLGKPIPEEKVKNFIQKHKKEIEDLNLPLYNESIDLERKQLEGIAKKYIPAVKEAKKIYNKIIFTKKKAQFIIEISIDEVENAQSPIELLFILLAISDEEIPIQTIAPKFIGQFNKGVDYKGDLNHFKHHFDALLRIIQYAKVNCHLLSEVKLSIHSGSDKFSIYPIINQLMKKYKTGVHLKTAGTTWLEELISIAQAGSEGLNLVKEIYQKAYTRYEELSNPYKNVIEIDKESLPKPRNLIEWDIYELVKNLQHNIFDKNCNPNLRQFLHIAYKIAAEMQIPFEKALKKYKEVVSKNVVENLYEKHILPLFG